MHSCESDHRSEYSGNKHSIQYFCPIKFLNLAAEEKMASTKKERWEEKHKEKQVDDVGRVASIHAGQDSKREKEAILKKQSDPKLTT